jgi:hypothetical protein
MYKAVAAVAVMGAVLFKTTLKVVGDADITGAAIACQDVHGDHAACLWNGNGRGERI